MRQCETVCGPLEYGMSTTSDSTAPADLRDNRVAFNDSGSVGVTILRGSFEAISGGNDSVRGVAARILFPTKATTLHSAVTSMLAAASVISPGAET